MKPNSLILPALCLLACSSEGLSPPSGVDASGVAVVASDYQSVSISLLDEAGAVLSSAIITSGTAKPGLSAALSGDVALPGSSQPGQGLVVIDRSTGVLTWVDTKDASVKRQLPVNTGFFANPQDYLELSPQKAFVTRAERNPTAGQESFDAGEDVLVIDPSAGTITSRISLEAVLVGQSEDLIARPGPMVLAAGRVWLLTSPFDALFTKDADSSLVEVDPELGAVARVLTLEGMRGCQTLALSPGGTELAIGCAGSFLRDPADGFEDSGVLLVKLGATLAVERKFTAKQLGIDQVGSLSYSSASSLAIVTMGRFGLTGPEAQDSLWSFDLALGALATAPAHRTAESPFSLGGVLCTEATCLVTNAETQGGVVSVYAVGPAGALAHVKDTVVDSATGLPPRSLGRF